MASLPSTPAQKYEVFLNFRGEDIRKKFISHLFHALGQRGIVTFMDDHSLENGQSLSSELFKSIEESKLAIVVFSQNYASSTWCLNELVKIMECKTKFGQIVIPIFYDVEPSDVRWQKNSFEKSFVRHGAAAAAAAAMAEKVQIWKQALKLATDLKGEVIEGRNEASVIQKIVEEIYEKLRPKASSKDLVGMDHSRMTKPMESETSKPTGAKRHMLSARELRISWGDDPKRCKWKSIPEFRVAEVAEVLDVYWLDIRGKIRAQKLSLNTTYEAYLVYKYKETCTGLDRAFKAFIRFVRADNPWVELAEVEGEARDVNLKEPSLIRENKWMEIKLGEIFIHEKYELETIEIMVWETDDYNRKHGISFAGIELCPLLHRKHSI